MNYVYILLCNKDIFYTGQTNNLEKRLLEHKSGYSPHTKRYKHVELMYSEQFVTRAQAEERENQLKGWSRAKKIALITGNKEKLVELSKSKS